MMAHPPPAKRMKLAVPDLPVGDGGANGEAASPRNRRLRQTLLVVLFMARVTVTVRTTMPATVSQINGMFQRYFSDTLRNYHEMSSKLEAFQEKVESKLETLQGQFEGLRHEVRQLARQRSNHRSHQHTSLDGSNQNIRLRFLNDLKVPIYTEKSITDENNGPIKVAIFEGDKMITSGPLSKVKVEILVLRGDFSNTERENWTEEEFDNYIVQGRDRQGLVLGTALLTNGEVELSHIRFKEGSCRRQIIMGVRIFKSKNTHVRVLEAITKPVTVLDRRNEPNEKRHPPKLDDDVYRLEEIARNGVYHKRLLVVGISTVQDFLKNLNMDSDKLCETLQMKKQRNSWAKLIGHARECALGDKPELKRYQSEDGSVMLFFNCVNDVIGAAFPHDYVASKEFNTSQKTLVNKWKIHAFNKLEDIQPEYVMKDNIPKKISPEPEPAVNSSCNEVIYDDTFTIYDCQILQDDQVLVDQGTLPLYQRQASSSGMQDWPQRPPGPADSESEFLSMIFPHPSVASASAQELPHPHLSQFQMVSAGSPAWKMAGTQPSWAEHEEGPNDHSVSRSRA